MSEELYKEENPQGLGDKIPDRKRILKEVSDKSFARIFLREANPDIQDDKEIVMATVKSNPSALQFASDRLRSDKEVVLTAIRADADMTMPEGGVLSYASDGLRNDKEIVLEAVKNNGMAIQYMSEELVNDKNFVLKALKNSGPYTFKVPYSFMWKLNKIHKIWDNDKVPGSDVKRCRS